jgi:hypothetical protein
MFKQAQREEEKERASKAQQKKDKLFRDVIDTALEIMNDRKVQPMPRLEAARLLLQALKDAR